MRPSEVITSLRARSEQGRATSHQKAIKGDSDDRYCPAGHAFSRMKLFERQRRLMKQDPSLRSLPPIACDGCLADIHDDYPADSAAGLLHSCLVCDIDFCENCFEESGKPLEELLENKQQDCEESDYLSPHAHNAEDSTIGGSASGGSGSGSQHRSLSSRSSGSGSYRTIPNLQMIPTKEVCAADHSLGRIDTIARKQYLQTRDCLDSLPAIECDCCSKEIVKDFIAGCCMLCDIDFCQDCFQNGQSFFDAIQDRMGPPLIPDENSVDHQNPASVRYNHQRPTYKGTGRVSYDDYPDPTAFQWSFTGSCEVLAVEFFEKDFARLGVVQLEFYYAKGTLRTLLQHPRKGQKQLFAKGKKLTAKLYRKILMDPRAHTDKKYHKSRKQLL